MTTLEELQSQLTTLANQQKDLFKAVTGLQTMFAGINQVFTMLATSLGDITQLDPKKMISDSETNAKDVKAIKAYAASLYTDMQKKVLPMLEKLTNGTHQEAVPE
jgi:hypothetical protein